ncbi:hypothetical protein KKA93_03255 [Patescibacteria group bacterium]|nr:hypothetical protein [Patescibacteria group bacterium]MBU1663602.1 hypothetical protein [Patescibacteria group bacterium]MBU1933913.1 hypothetical protein [Patescibacteria group bacterium]MBU2007654.1 hypothetical protein [Patescibacteria group bacterium]MBU2233851.1 hypothetical protein [Patescibacteria group bacterium]
MQNNAIRKTLSSVWFIHSMVGLGLFALFGYIKFDNKYFLLCVALSFSGAICGAFIRVIDAIVNKK